MNKESMTVLTENIEDDFVYDGFYFHFPRADQLEEDEESDDRMSYFKIASDKTLPNVPTEKHPIGNKFLMAFLKFDDENKPVFDETVEAILADPVVYAQNLQGSGLFGCIVRKTPRGEAWFDKHYVQNAYKVIAEAKNRLKTELE
jgi:hypothetical protein